jgi:hypothetical protein
MVSGVMQKALPEFLFTGTTLNNSIDRTFFNSVTKGNYRALSSWNEQETVIHEGDCYIGQPSATMLCTVTAEPIS